MAKIRRLVLDILIPHAADVLKMSESLADLESVEAVNTMIEEMDKNTINVKVTMQGSSLNYEEIEKSISALGGSVHSLDNVVAGKYIVEDVETPQD